MGTGCPYQAEEGTGPLRQLPWALRPGRHTHGGLGLEWEAKPFPDDQSLGFKEVWMPCLAFRIQFREKEKCLVSGSCLIIRLGVWSRVKNCGIDKTKWANSEEDRKVDFRTRHLLLQISQMQSSQLLVRTPPSHLWLFWAPLIHTPEELSTPSAVISTCFIPFWRCPSSVYV